MPEAKAILFIDSHASREVPETLKKLKQANCDCITFPADSTHILQALDVGIFGPFKSYLKSIRDRINDMNLTWNDNDIEMKKSQTRRIKLVMAASDALRQATTTINIKHAFAKAGLWPPNKEKPLQNSRIGNSTDVTISLGNHRKRKRISIANRIITKDEVIIEIANAKTEIEKKRYVIGFQMIVVMFFMLSIFVDRQSCKGSYSRILSNPSQ